MAAPPRTSWLTAARRRFDQNLPWLVLAWGLGLGVMSLRLLGGLLYVRRLRSYRTRPLPAAWQDRLGALTARAGLRRPVALLESGLVAAPLVVGHLRPLVLLPLGAVAGLPVACVEAILAHELAHVLRRDYLVNLLQTLAETVFFYHPAVWYLGQCLRAERENCCDDLATQLVGGDPLRLARALTALAEWGQAAALAPAPRLALAATGGRGSLLGRVRRLLQAPPARPTRGESLAAVALLLGGLGLLGTGVALAGPGQRLRPPVPAVPGAWHSALSPADTAKRLAKVPVPPVAPVPPSPPAPVAAEAPEAPPAPAAPEAAPVPEVPAAPDAPRPPRPRRRSGQQGPGSTVIIEKDKKGRLTNLVVDGQRVETQAPGSKKGRAGKKTQVEVIQVPEAGAWAFPGGPDAGLQALALGPNGQVLGSAMDPAQQAEWTKTREKLFREQAKLFRSQKDLSRLQNQLRLQNQQFSTLNFQVPLALDTDRIERDAVAEAGRSLRQQLQSPDLSPEDRRATEQAFEALQDERAAGRDARRADSEAAEADRDAREADLDADRDAPRAADRRRELQEQIRSAQRELSALRRTELLARAGAPARAPRAPQAPPAPPTPPSSTKMRDELRRDGLIGASAKSFSFQLDDKGGRVNGQALTPAQAEKYRRLFLPNAAKNSGRTRSKSSLNINVDER